MSEKYLTPAEATREGFLTNAEGLELQSIADKFNTTFFVVGSRAQGKGRNIGQPHLPIGKDSAATRSDIDVRIDSQADINSGGRLSHAISNASNGAGSPMPLIGQSPNPPAITFKPRHR
jgi:hypothetical protein